jgi:hypothetical protein
MLPTRSIALAALATATPVFRPGIACCTAAAQPTDDARKFHQHAVDSGPGDEAMMFADFRIEELAAQRFAANTPPHRWQGPRRDVGSQSSLPPRLAQTFEQVGVVFRLV